MDFIKLIIIFRLFFETKFHMISSTANMVNSILYLISAFLSPFLGFLIDKLGKNVSVVFCSLLITVIGHIVLTLTQFNPIISMVSIIVIIFVSFI